MFLNNKYTRWYQQIIDNAKNRILEGYVEKHHIIPKALNGTDDKINIVSLTAREHFICHLLLTKMCASIYHTKKMQYALQMFKMNNKQVKRDLTAGQYQLAKIQTSKANKGRKLSQEHIIKMKEARQAKGSVWNKGIPMLKIRKDHLRQLANTPARQEISSTNGKKRKGQTPWNKGVPRTDEVKKKISQARAKDWKVFYPDGRVAVITNLNQFCKENNLTQSNLVITANSTTKLHKGFRVLRQ